ncbi:MAG: isoprenylcysteine carboxylmethyltransferase family protein [Candidatus Kapabacteria bacterium]|nr:isoprenylcysteine carboxylmethyltransferase family protein [Candidatus Kapabacteria bacterium]
MKKIISFLVGIVIFVLLPILGWGISDLDGYFGNFYRMAFLVIMTFSTFLVVIFVPNEGRGFGDGDKKKLVKRQKFTILTLQIVPILIMIFSPYFDRYSIFTFSDNDYIRLIGLLFSIIGFFFMNWSIIVLGKHFSLNVTIQDNHKLIKNCPYGIIRHPRYLGIIVFIVGIPITFVSIIPLILDLFVIGVILWRIKDEEELLRIEFKDEWDEYKKSTYSLIPFIY